MRRRRSDQLPRFTGGEDARPLAFRFRRRHALYLCGVLLVCWWFLYPSAEGASTRGATKWSNYAYSLYATDSATLCHALLLFDALARLGSRADRVLFYPQHWDTEVTDARDRDSQLLVLARDQYQVKLHPVKLLTVEGRTQDEWTGTWDKSVTKFMAFSLAYYDRVIAMDSDVTLLKNIDELFLLPSTPMAMPRAYWADSKPWPLTSMLMVLQPDLDEFERFKQTLGGGGHKELVDAHRFDMELVNERFEESALVLPHRPYALLTGEFRRHDHSAYLGNVFETWDADKVYGEAKLVHFSDWPLPKPWIMWPTEGLEEMQPDCGGSHVGSCAERKIWKHLYDDFRRRRRDICKLLSVPAPDWWTIKHGKRPGNATDGTEHAAPSANASVLGGGSG
ncbi:uncharacterized protein EKO05_0009731 [Ascochyta rabiei]|uniref:Uncharacterized protein n=1 Tax=Didymella rabiei TaxID=5454 RepID=A0A163CSM1_DIDRA|nr:uncharacterized protein EKO05_0009731 [Ascochyta rabiei]KZM22665.1 hypothetical protein ST47_g6160 [Ascochyta rabiei]UPX19471.1 hypothetical protein EKO05_0009731 [Ascochyta rabiei]